MALSKLNIMNYWRYLLLCCCGIIGFSCEKESAKIVENTVYFPDNSTNNWENISLNTLQWSTAAANDLKAYLEQKNTKGFIILVDGKIALEYYLNGHTQNSSWYWASAGKTLTVVTTQIAVENGRLQWDNRVSDFLNRGWTSLTLEQENKITNWHLATMTSGLDDSKGDNVAPSNLVYKADAGSIWAYHNVYVKLQDVVAKATQKSWDTFFDDALKSKIGMTGTWINSNDFSVYWSTTRSMARFGLLMQREGQWQKERILSKEGVYLLTHTSQNINEAYGYLWWINGKNTYHLPQTQFTFNGSLVPNAPADMYCALGKNDQKIYVVPSKKMVVVRMGNSADTSNMALSDFDNVLWQKINALYQ